MTASMETRRRVRRGALVVGVVLLALFIAVALYLTSDGFRDRVRREVVARLAQATGGQVELGTFEWRLARLEFEARDLVIRGQELPGEAPLLRADRVFVRLKIGTLIRPRIGLRYLAVERPHIRVVLDEEGRSNLPRPGRPGERTAVETLFELAANEVVLTNGELQFNEQRIPLALHARGLEASMTYAPARQRYEGNLRVAALEHRLAGDRELHATAEAGFYVYPGHADITAFRWSTAHSSLEGSGRVDDYRARTIRVAYRGRLDLVEVAGLLAMPELRAGHLDVQGSATYSGPEQFASAGKLALHGLAYRGRLVRIDGVSGTSSFLFDAEHLELTQIAGYVFGGALSGSARVDRWLADEPVGRAAHPRHGSAQLQVRRMLLRPALRSISSPHLPLHQLAIAGAASGPLRLEFTGRLQDTRAHMELAVDPATRAAPGEISVQGHFEATYDGRREQLQIHRSQLGFEDAEWLASGTLGVRESELELQLRTSTLQPFRAFLNNWLPGDEVTVELDGAALFRGRVQGRVDALSLAGRLESEAFWIQADRSRLPRLLQTGADPFLMRWDGLVADLELTPEIFRAEGALQRGPARLAFRGSTELRRGRADENAPLQLALDARQIDAAEALSLLAVDAPLGGQLDLTLDISGSAQQPQGSGSLILSPALVAGERFERATADLAFAASEVRVSNVVAQQNGGRVTGGGTYRWEQQAFTFMLQAEQIHLAQMDFFRRRGFAVEGVATFQASGEGTAQRPVVNAQGTIAGLVLNGEPLGDVTAKAVTKGDITTLQAHSSLEEAQLTAEGTVALRENLPVDLQIRFAALDLLPYVRTYVEDVQARGSARAEGTVRVRGPLLQREQITLAGELPSLVVRVETLEVRNREPVRFAVRNDVLTLEPVTFLGDGTDLRASGTVELSGARRLNLAAEGSLNLKLAETFEPALRASGLAEVQLRVAGTLRSPSITGQVQVRDAGLALADLPNALSDLQGTLLFNENRLQVQSLRARTGGGHLRLGGYIAYRDGVYFELSGVGEEIRVRYPPGVSSVANADLRLVGTVKNALLSGEIVVTRFNLNPRFDFAQYLTRTQQPVITSGAEGVLNNIRLDLRVITTPELQVQTTLARVSGDADLRLRGTAARPAVLGRVNIAEGNIIFNGTEYRLERGDITFSNPVRIEPILNMEATARVREYEITLSFHGTTERLNTTYRSEPPLPPGDIIALLALGRTREDALLHGGPSAFHENASSAILTQALNATVSSRVQRLFGVSRIKIDPQTGGVQNARARVTIEQAVNQNLTLTYITNLSEAQQQVIQMEYNVNRNLSIVAVRDQNGVVAFDVKFRQRRR